MLKRILVVAAVLLAGTAATASAAEYTGNLNGSNYYVNVPDSGWNGTFVVIAHGIRDLADHAGEVDDTTPGFEGTAASFAANGYAVATTSYRKNGWAVKEAIVDVVDIAEFVKAGSFLPSAPTRTLLVGDSMGGLTTLARAERGGFDGYLAQCAPGAGASRLWDSVGAARLAYDVVLGLPASWGTVGDGDDDIDNVLDGVGSTVGMWLSSYANYAKFEFARYVTGITWTPTWYTSGIFGGFLLYTEFLGELERRANGPVVQNLEHTYTLPDAQKQAVVDANPTDDVTSIADVDEWLAEMNATRYSAPRSSRNYIGHYSDFTGKIKTPVLTMHTATDNTILVNHESAYAATVAAAGRSSLLRQWFTTGADHCQFTFQQRLAALDALDAWVETGAAPAAPPTYVSGFLPFFVPPPWLFGA